MGCVPDLDVGVVTPVDSELFEETREPATGERPESRCARRDDGEVGLDRRRHVPYRVRSIASHGVEDDVDVVEPHDTHHRCSACYDQHSLRYRCLEAFLRQCPATNLHYTQHKNAYQSIADPLVNFKINKDKQRQRQDKNVGDNVDGGQRETVHARVDACSSHADIPGSADRGALEYDNEANGKNLQDIEPQQTVHAEPEPRSVSAQAKEENERRDLDQGQYGVVNDLRQEVLEVTLICRVLGHLIMMNADV